MCSLYNAASFGECLKLRLTHHPAVPRHYASYSSMPNRSQRWHSSDDESDGLNYSDSVFGEIESNISFGDDAGESDASLEHQTTMGRDIFIQLDTQSYINIDTDIDPMNAGLDQWDSDDPEDEQMTSLKSLIWMKQATPCRSTGSDGLISTQVDWMSRNPKILC